MTTHGALLATATRAGRDRYVDLLRVASLAVVILGHWLMAVVVVGPDGSTTATNLLAVVPWLQPLTWLLQVMPVFFFVGGFSHATALASVHRRGGGYAEFVRNRAGRLLRPTAVFVAVWLALSLCVEVTGHDRGLLRLATGTVAQPLWFIGVYLGFVALAPPMWHLHVRLGRYAAAVPVALALGAVAVDVARFAGGMTNVGLINAALIWLAIHQLGFFYADTSLTRGGMRLAAGLAGGGLAATVALTTYGPYPVSMVGVPGDRMSNMFPPTAALLAQSVWMTGVVLALRVPLTRWLARPRVWKRVVTANSLAMTAFLWHLTALLSATALTVALGVAQPAAGSVAWWLLRPAWIGVLVLFTAALVLAFRRAERPRPTAVLTPSGAPPRTGTAVAAAGAILSTFGVLGLSAVGFGGMIAGRTATLGALSVTPLRSAIALAAGVVLLGVAAPNPRLPMPDDHALIRD